MNKKLLKVGRVLGLIVLGIAIFFGGTWMLTGGAREQANRVLAAVKAHDSKALAPLLTPELIKVASPEKVMHMARTWRLQEADQLHWNKWSVGNDGVDLQGRFEHADGREQSLQMTFILRDGKWQMNRIKSSDPALITDPLALSVPSGDELAALIGRATDAFGQAVQTGDVTVFHASMSSQLRAGMTPEELASQLAEFLSSRAKISAFTKSMPLLDSPPGITPQGELIVTGHYPWRSTRLQFHYEFVYEHGTWLVSIFNFSIESANPDVPVEYPVLG